MAALAHIGLAALASTTAHVVVPPTSTTACPECILVPPGRSWSLETSTLDMPINLHTTASPMSTSTSVIVSTTRLPANQWSVEHEVQTLILMLLEGGDWGVQIASVLPEFMVDVAYLFDKESRLDPSTDYDTDSDTDSDTNCDIDVNEDDDTECDTDYDTDYDTDVNEDDDTECDIDCDTDCDTDADEDDDSNDDSPGISVKAPASASAVITVEPRMVPSSTSSRTLSSTSSRTPSRTSSRTSSTETSIETTASASAAVEVEASVSVSLVLVPTSSSTSNETDSDPDDDTEGPASVSAAVEVRASMSASSTSDETDSDAEDGIEAIASVSATVGVQATPSSTSDETDSDAEDGIGAIVSVSAALQIQPSMNATSGNEASASHGTHLHSTMTSPTIRTATAEAKYLARDASCIGAGAAVSSALAEGMESIAEGMEPIMDSFTTFEDTYSFTALESLHPKARSASKTPSPWLTITKTTTLYPWTPIYPSKAPDPWSNTTTTTITYVDRCTTTTRSPTLQVRAAKDTPPPTATTLVVSPSLLTVLTLDPDKKDHRHRLCHGAFCNVMQYTGEILIGALILTVLLLLARCSYAGVCALLRKYGILSYVPEEKVADAEMGRDNDEVREIVDRGSSGSGQGGHDGRTEEA